MGLLIYFGLIALDEYAGLNIFPKGGYKEGSILVVAITIAFTTINYGLLKIFKRISQTFNLFLSKLQNSKDSGTARSATSLKLTIHLTALVSIAFAAWSNNHLFLLVSTALCILSIEIRNDKATIELMVVVTTWILLHADRVFLEFCLFNKNYTMKDTYDQNSLTFFSAIVFLLLCMLQIPKPTLIKDCGFLLIAPVAYIIGAPGDSIHNVKVAVSATLYMLSALMLIQSREKLFKKKIKEN